MRLHVVLIIQRKADEDTVVDVQHRHGEADHAARSVSVIVSAAHR